MKMRVVLLSTVAMFAACTLEQEHDHDTPWARFAATGRHITAPVEVDHNFFVGITTRGAGALVDEHGGVVGTLAGANDRSATCVLVRLDERGAITWQTPVIADDAQTRCVSLELRDDGALLARGETFDVDEDSVTVHAGDARTTLRDDEEWLVERTGDDFELDAVARMDACTPALSALAAAFEDVRQSVREGSGYFDLRGATQHVGAALVPQGASLDALVPGATAPAVDESAVESVAAIVRPATE